MGYDYYKGSCQVDLYTVESACLNFKNRCSELLILYKEDINRLKSETMRVGFIFKRDVNKYKVLTEAARDYWCGQREYYVLYWIDGLGTSWSEKDKTAFTTGLTGAYQDLHRLTLVKPDYVSVTPEQALFISTWSS